MGAHSSKTRAQGSAGRAETRPRGSLSREEILEAGLRIAREDDLRSLTMQRLGDELGVTPMAVYRYFQNKGEIVEGVLDRFVEESAAVTSRDDPNEDWRVRLRGTFCAMRSSILATPGVLPLLGTSSSMGRGSMLVLNEALQVLHGAGFSRESAAEAFFALMGFTLGACSQELAWTRPIEGEPGSERAERVRQVRSTFESQSRTRYPAIVDSAPELAEIVARYPFERGLDRILAALESELAVAG